TTRSARHCTFANSSHEGVRYRQGLTITNWESPVNPETHPGSARDARTARSTHAIWIGAIAVGGISALVGATTLHPLIFAASTVVGASIGAALGAAVAFGRRNDG